MSGSTESAGRISAARIGATGFTKTGCGAAGRVPSLWQDDRPMHSCVYQGFVRHRRFQPLVRHFSYRLTYLYLDLSEFGDLLQRLPLFSDRRLAWASVYRPDHMGAEHDSLDAAVRHFVRKTTDTSAAGPIRLLTLWRCLGAYFSPINLYFCFADADSNQVESIVAEVNNTPWGEQHCYVLWSGNRTGARHLAFQHPKEFHVSPFMDLDLSYRWQILPPAERLAVHLGTWRKDERLFDATLSLRRRDLNLRSWLATTAPTYSPDACLDRHLLRGVSAMDPKMPLLSASVTAVQKRKEVKSHATGAEIHCRKSPLSFGACERKRSSMPRRRPPCRADDRLAALGFPGSGSSESLGTLVGRAGVSPPANHATWCVADRRSGRTSRVWCSRG